MGKHVGLPDELLMSCGEGFECEFCGGEESGDAGEIGSTAFEAVGAGVWLFEREAVGAGAAADEGLDELLGVRSEGDEADALGAGESFVGAGGEEIDIQLGH
jgi:hypothetical protein